ncbi:MAG: nucleotidyl transferase AbiEii/AbiGii toxin family protein [Clostridium sp.]|nr:nucleotidyl transferase AbiEii/AbiGii toxin family protein [Clostridium sp.]
MITVQFDRMILGRMAKELGFVRDTLEKVCRLVDVLQFMSGDNSLSKYLALKGGTAINLTIFNLPRLSVDIDLDFCGDISKEEMLKNRQVITDKISKYMAAKGYILSAKTKNHHALDSFVYEYVNTGGVRDNLKIEINYMLRCHVLPVGQREVKLPWNKERFTVLSVAPLEIFASKTVALLTRTAPRDLYDTYNMVRYGLFDGQEQEMLRKCIVFYSAIGAEKPPMRFELENIGNVSTRQIKRELIPVLKAKEQFNLSIVQEEVKSYLGKGLIPTAGEQMFWKAFAEGKYHPEWIFGQSNELWNVKNHPMALWKCQNGHFNINGQKSENL